jgi:hypothetical protein
MPQTWKAFTGRKLPQAGSPTSHSLGGSAHDPVGPWLRSWTASVTCWRRPAEAVRSVSPAVAGSRHETNESACAAGRSCTVAAPPTTCAAAGSGRHDSGIRALLVSGEPRARADARVRIEPARACGAPDPGAGRGGAGVADAGGDASDPDPSRRGRLRRPRAPAAPGSPTTRSEAAQRWGSSSSRRARKRPRTRSSGRWYPETRGR